MNIFTEIKIKDIVEKDLPKNLDQQNSYGETLLIASITYGKLSNVKLLIKKGVDVNACDNNGLTPLMHAFFWGKLKIMELLYSNGAKLEAKTNYGITTETYAKLACSNRYPVIDEYYNYK